MKYIKQKPFKKKKKRDYLVEEWFKNITEEIKKYPQELLLEFDRLLPCKQEKRFKLWVVRDGDLIIIKSRSRSLGYTLMPSNYKSFIHPDKYIYCYSADDFWSRWNRFKKLKAFYEDTI